jgi:ribosome-associated protein
MPTACFDHASPHQDAAFMFEINARLQIPEHEFQWSFARSGGPGGQNVNKVASKAELRWNVADSPSLPDDVKTRLMAQVRKRINIEGELVLTSQRFRDQGRNRDDCLEKLRALILHAATPPRPRKATRPTRASRLHRLEAKKHRSATKQSRGRPAID